MAARSTPYDLAFADIADDRFAGIRASLQQGGIDPRDRDAFLMVREVVMLIRDLRPEGGMGEGIDQLAALVHHVYLFWDAEAPVFTIPPNRLAEVLAGQLEQGDSAPPTAFYAQFPERRIWATVVPAQPAEPLDGCFIHAAGAELRVLGVFGIRPDRMGFSVVEARGEQPKSLERPDGTPLFSPDLPGGSAAGLYSLIGAEELLELGWRTRTAASQLPAEAS